MLRPRCRAAGLAAAAAGQLQGTSRGVDADRFRFPPPVPISLISTYYVHKLDAQRKLMPYVAGYRPGRARPMGRSSA